ncbi:hypothetical protein, partial [Alistipes sp.]|uniref:hypothetical protein n=1 Tax=Alistipes sp. TaxID=1872444 RepID=UPI0023F390F3
PFPTPKNTYRGLILSMKFIAHFLIIKDGTFYVNLHATHHLISFDFLNIVYFLLFYTEIKGII